MKRIEPSVYGNTHLTAYGRAMLRQIHDECWPHRTPPPKPEDKAEELRIQQCNARDQKLRFGGATENWS